MKSLFSYLNIVSPFLFLIYKFHSQIITIEKNFKNKWMKNEKKYLSKKSLENTF